MAAVPAAGDSAAVVLWPEVDRTAEGLASISARDAAAWPRFVAELAERAAALEPLLCRPPELADMGRLLIAPELLRFVSAPLDELLREWFETRALAAGLCGLALPATGMGPRANGTGWPLLYHCALGGSDRLAPVVRARGGAAGLARALSASAGASGAVFRTGAVVSRILVEEGRVAGVQLADGERVEAGAVISTADAHRHLPRPGRRAATRTPLRPPAAQREVPRRGGTSGAVSRRSASVPRPGTAGPHRADRAGPGSGRHRACGRRGEVRPLAGASVDRSGAADGSRPVTGAHRAASAAGDGAPPSVRSRAWLGFGRSGTRRPDAGRA